MRARLRELTDRLELNLKLLEAYLIVRDPDNAKSAEAFDGMRKKVDSAYRYRRRLLALLAELDRTARSVSDIELLRAKIREAVELEGLVIVEHWDPELAQAFKLIGPREGNVFVSSPAYLDVDETGRTEVIKEGIAESGSLRDSAIGHSTPPDQGDEPATTVDREGDVR